MIENQRKEKQQRDALTLLQQEYNQAEQDLRRITSKVLILIIFLRLRP